MLITTTEILQGSEITEPVNFSASKVFGPWYNPNLALGEGCRVPVYVNPKNALKYFVDVREVMRGKAYDLAC